MEYRMSIALLAVIIALILSILHVVGVGDSRLVGIAVVIVCAVLIHDSF